MVDPVSSRVAQSFRDMFLQPTLHALTYARYVGIAKAADVSLELRVQDMKASLSKQRVMPRLVNVEALVRAPIRV
jgi:hypothetical protein